MRRRNAAAFFCTALLLQGCAAGTNAVEGLSALATRANPFSSDSVAASKSKLYLGLVEGLTREGRHDAALAFLDEYRQSGGELSPTYWLLRGNALLALSREREAVAAFSELERTPLFADGLNGLGRVAAAERNWAVAENNFGRAAKGDPANPDFLNNLAFAELNLREVDRATAQFEQARELDPNSDRIRTNLIIALTLEGDLKRANLMMADIKDGDHRERVRTLVNGVVAAITQETKS